MEKEVKTIKDLAMEKFLIYAAGDFIDTGEYLEVQNSFNNEVFAQAALGRACDFEAAVRKGLALEKTARDLPSHVRYAALMFIAQEIERDKERFTRILASEACKPWKLAVGEVDRAIATFVAAAEEAKRLPGEVLSLDWTPGGTGKEGIVKYFPVGLVGGISPFNFPLNLAVHKIAPAIAAGCPIILKPSSTTPLSTLELAKVIDQSPLPKGMVSIIPFDRTLGNQLVTDDRIKLITFTGSPAVGWKMKKEAGRKRVVLELGGNAGVIVAPSANLKMAAAKCTAGAFSYAGQVCIHTQRIYVHESVFKEFTDIMMEQVACLKQGHPLENDTDISSMINEENAIRIENWIQEARVGGAEVLMGGHRNGSAFEPTILTNTQAEMKVCHLEVFGPVVVIEPYHDFDQAVDWINQSAYGLQAGIFTDSIHEMNTAFREIEVGGLMVNEVPTFRVDHMPYGGVKNSGFGREGIKYAILDMMEPRLMVKNMD